MTPSSFDLPLSSGTLRAYRYGSPDAPLVLCIPGLSANAHSFGAIAPVVARAGLQVVALDLRGRGHSPGGGPGSHGWPNHARDVLAAASALGAERFELIGHSMGAYVGLATLGLAQERLGRVVLIDALAPPEPKALAPIGAGLQRLERVFPSEDAYVAAIRDAGVISPWNDVWERHYRYETLAVPGGVRARTDVAAVREDLEYGKAHDARVYWSRVGPRSLAVRALQPLPGGGWVLSRQDFERFGREVPQAQRLEVDANHYSVMTHPQTLEALAAFFAG